MTRLVNQPSAAPTRKVAAASLAALAGYVVRTLGAPTAP